ncbi:CATRA conflict system CASPASE/TPR repeat-associated protein [Nonomuraea sp. NPDC048826]|uniref:CATRA conflict system CASPASE/TPR repeat-associated protein n=1 Tax=Nonomuraea sp. NPDC048826 TaxID=3364347 RepID=UPI00371B34B9
MEPADLADPGLIVHVFAAAKGPEAREHERRLRGIWDVLGDRLDMPARRTGEIEVRTAPGEPLRQAVLRVDGDVRCLSVALTGGSWAELDRLWRECAGATGAWVMGECRLFVAYVRTAPTARRTKSVLAALPEADGRSRMTTVRGVAVWETGVEDDERTRRTFALLAPRELEAKLDAWAWTRGDDRMPPLARHLMHAAKLRYELRVYRRGEAFREARNRVDEQVEALLKALGDDDLPDARRELATRQIAAAGLIWSLTRLRELRKTAEIARHNMRERNLADDLELADWFLLRLDDDLAYGEATRERAREIGVIADQVIAERLQRRAEETARRWERFRVLETAVVGTLLMMLAAIQALGYRVPVPEHVKPYIVAALGLTAFALTAFGLVRWRRNR